MRPYWHDNYDHAAEDRRDNAADLANDEQAVKEHDSSAIAGLLVECDDRQRRAQLVTRLIARLNVEHLLAERAEVVR